MKIKPQGKLVATGEDGVPWDLYENGYLLFKPTKEKNTLTNPTNNNSWKEQYGKKIVAIDFTDTVFMPEDSSYFFSKHNKNFTDILIQLQYINTGKINTSKVKDMRQMFYKAPMLKTLDLNDCDTSNVTDMYAMFCGASNLTTLLLNNWNTSNV